MGDFAAEATAGGALATVIAAVTAALAVVTVAAVATARRAVVTTEATAGGALATVVTSVAAALADVTGEAESTAPRDDDTVGQSYDARALDTARATDVEGESARVGYIFQETESLGGLG
ncbi:hypothetical protein PUR71_02760, partial [Streptomyces sp. SP17BM10]|uniref:hypothetical protein n=1 Tax=Streptomyces sp. SP17BM10 TaxID=3002530 RepID=UPI002E76E4FA